MMNHRGRKSAVAAPTKRHRERTYLRSGHLLCGSTDAAHAEVEQLSSVERGSVQFRSQGAEARGAEHRVHDDSRHCFFVYVRPENALRDASSEDVADEVVQGQQQ